MKDFDLPEYFALVAVLVMGFGFAGGCFILTATWLF